jgi:hypothetical protein
MTNDLDRAAREESIDDAIEHLPLVASRTQAQQHGERMFKAGAAFERSRGAEVFVVERQHGDPAWHVWEMFPSRERAELRTRGITLSDNYGLRIRPARLIMEPTDER